MNILVLDNYDSFTYNLVYLLRKESVDIDVYKNDQISADQCMNYDGIVLSPGPGLPKDAGRLMAIITRCAGHVPILGVCLGHQAIAQFLGGSLRRLDQVYHGAQSNITLQNSSSVLFNQVPRVFQAGRYHSWDITPMEDYPFEITALDEDGSIMAIQHFEQKLYGIQFHPESIMTPNGGQIINNFLRICKEFIK